jgi:hypothetical protein
MQMQKEVRPMDNAAGTTILQIVLGVVAAVLVMATLTGRSLPLVSGERAAFFALVIIGLVMCTLGMGRSIANYGWTSPINLIGVLLGVGILLLALAELVGWKVPLVPTEREALIAVALIGVVKVFLAIIQSVLPRLNA